MSYYSLKGYPDAFDTSFSSFYFDKYLRSSSPSSRYPNHSLGSGFMESSIFMSQSTNLTKPSRSMLSFSKTDDSDYANFSMEMDRFFAMDDPKVTPLRKQCFYIITMKVFSSSILTVIAINTIILALQTTYFLNANYGWYFSFLDQVFLGIYIMEMILKLYVYRLKYFKSGWNNFDFFIVMSSIFSFLLPVFVQSNSSFDPKVTRLFRVFRAFRAIRSLRALRAISFLRSLQVIVQTVLRSVPAMSSILALSGLILYIFAVIGRTLFSTLDPKFFGTLGISIFRLYSFITLDNWSDAFRTDTSLINLDVFFFQFFYIILESFVFLNLFIAVIVSNLSEVQKRSDKMNKMDLLQAETEYRIQQRNASTTEWLPKSLDPNKEYELKLTDILKSEVGLDTYYPPSLNQRNKVLLSIFFMQVAALERNEHFYHRHQQTLEDMVDLLQSSNKTKR